MEIAFKNKCAFSKVMGFKPIAIINRYQLIFRPANF